MNMQGIEVTVHDMMACRDRRAYIQRKLLKEYNVPVISFSMNIPGSVKTTPLIRSGFERGKMALLRSLDSRDIALFQSYEFHECTGDELIIAADASAKMLKNLACAIEEESPLGRLFDIDIIDTDGTKLSRPVRRKCLICNCEAQDCARSRKHTVSQMQDKICRILSVSE